MANIPTNSVSDHQVWFYKPTSYSSIITTTGQVKATDGILKGIFCQAGTPTITVYDNPAATGTVLLGPFVAAAATMYTLPDVKFDNGCFVSLTNAGTVRLFYK